MNNNKIKTASKVALLVLAATAYVFLGSNQSGVEAKSSASGPETVQVDTTFQTLPYPSGPVNPQQSGPRSMIEPLCPGDEVTCAVSTSPAEPVRIIEWEGNQDKF